MDEVNRCPATPGVWNEERVPMDEGDTGSGWLVTQPTIGPSRPCGRGSEARKTCSVVWTWASGLLRAALLEDQPSGATVRVLVLGDVRDWLRKPSHEGPTAAGPVDGRGESRRGSVKDESSPQHAHEVRDGAEHAGHAREDRSTSIGSVTTGTGTLNAAAYFFSS